METNTTYLGDVVVCDLCNKDYTQSDEEGGCQFGSNAVCPDCMPKILESAKKYGELDHVKHYCPKGMPFRKFVTEILRNGEPGYISIMTG